MRAPRESHRASSGRTPAQVKGSAILASSLHRACYAARRYTQWKHAETDREPEEFFDRR